MQKIFGLLFFLTFLFFTQGNVLGQDNQVKQDELPKLKAELDGAIDKILQRSRLASDQLSYALFDFDTQEMISSYNSEIVSPLASVTKILTAYYGLKKLGENYRYSTELYMHPENKNLYLIGHGDPLFTSNDLVNFCIDLSKLKTNFKDSKFFYVQDDPYFKNEISDLGMGDSTYNSSVAGLNINFNRMTITKQNSSRRGGNFTSIPLLPHVHIKSTSENFKNGQRFKWVPIPYEDENWEVSNKEKYAYAEEIPIKRPGKMTAELMKLYCDFEGVPLSGPLELPFKKVELTQLKRISKIDSIPLSEIVKLTLEYSNNLLAESILLKTSSSELKSDLTLRNAANEMISWYKKTFQGLEWEEITLINGSGLTSENLISPRLLAKILLKTLNEKFDSHYMKSLLPLSGHNGWIRDRFLNQLAGHKIWGKTGSLDYVNNLAGMLHTSKGKKIVFVLFFTDKDKRNILDKENSAKTEMLKKLAPRWKQQSTNVMVQLINHWIGRF